MSRRSLGVLGEDVWPKSPDEEDAAASRAARAGSRVLEEPPRVRDNFQLELKLRHALPQGQHAIERAVEIYFYLPPSLGIHREIYDREDFYHDLRCYVRLKTPTIPLDELVTSGRGPLSGLDAAVMRLQAHTDPAAVRLFEYQVKLFCCALKSSLRDFVERLAAAGEDASAARLVGRYRTSVAAVCDAFHDLGGRLRATAMPPQVTRMYRFADEYVSLLVEDYTYRLLTGLRAAGSGVETDARARLLPLVAAELRHREHEGYPSLPDSTGDNERLIFRRGVLKKYVSDVLFFRTRAGPGRGFVRRTVLGIAAGAAMLLALAALWATRWSYGPLLLPVLIAAVVGYAFRSHIRELARLYLARRFVNVLSDHRTDIYSGPHDHIGVCEESVDYLAGDRVPATVAAIRNRDHITEIEDTWVGEQIIRYRRRLRLFPERIRDVYAGVEVNGINDIIRFNVNELVRRTGPTQKPVYVVDEDDYRRVRGERVYHLNLIIRAGTAPPYGYDRLRVVLNKDGIKRIETVPVAVTG